MVLPCLVKFITSNNSSNSCSRPSPLIFWQVNEFHLNANKRKTTTWARISDQAHLWLIELQITKPEWSITFASCWCSYTSIHVCNTTRRHVRFLLFRCFVSEAGKLSRTTKSCLAGAQPNAKTANSQMLAPIYMTSCVGTATRNSGSILSKRRVYWVWL